MEWGLEKLTGARVYRGGGGARVGNIIGLAYVSKKIITKKYNEL